MSAVGVTQTAALVLLSLVSWRGFAYHANPPGFIRLIPGFSRRLGMFASNAAPIGTRPMNSDLRDLPLFVPSHIKLPGYSKKDF